MGLALGIASHRWGRNRRVARPRAIIRDARVPLISLLATLFLFSTFAAAVHIRPPADAVRLSEILAALGETPESVLLSICHHSDEDTSGSVPDHRQTLPCEKCPFCVAFHHLPPVPPLGFDRTAYGPSGSATFLPDRSELEHVRKAAGQIRPRAPPLA